ncbi:MAG: gliding motility protein GldN [Chitinophagaceae bacterium]|nr:gliding motility protein GldN [Chitinophagaceae bacterium]
MKNIIKIKSIVAAAVLLSTNAFAQPGVPPPGGVVDPNVAGGAAQIVNTDWKPSLRKDGAIDKVEHNNYVTPWQRIREADVLWKKRVWREIDTRQKQNFPFRYPGDEESGGGMYIEILLHAIKQGQVTAFNDERFTSPLSLEDVMGKLAEKADTNEVENPDGTFSQIITVRKFNPDDITKFRLKEDWIFDKNVGRMVVRIIGLAPYIDRKNADGSYRLSLPLFWVHYEDIRDHNAKFEVYNPENDVFRITWDDFFEKRLFSSYVLKSTINNPLQEDIKNYKKNIDILNEGEDIKEKIFNREHDMWVY